MVPMNATMKHPKKIGGEAGNDFREITNATKAAQNGDRFKTPAVMMGWALLKPMLYNSRPAIPINNNIASFAMFPASLSRATKSRRLSLRAISRGTDETRAICVKPTKYDELRLLAASAENGSCTANRAAVITEYTAPSR
jgi:hypothetical protein